MDVAIPQYVGTNQFSYVFPTTYQSITNVVFLDDAKVNHIAM